MLGEGCTAERGCPSKLVWWVMEIQLQCDCGETITVTEAKAESDVPCKCGREVRVPPFVELKRMAGMTLDVPELLVERLLAAGKLPEETACIICGVQTNAVCRCWLECARALVRPAGASFSFTNLLVFLFTGFLFINRRPHQEFGHDRVFYLPLRVCPRCRGTFEEPRALKAALGRVPAYRDLLAKYPQARAQVVKD